LKFDRLKFTIFRGKNKFFSKIQLVLHALKSPTGEAPKGTNDKNHPYRARDGFFNA
jgi:hypothetical protein